MNISGGWELRNKYLKNSSSPKDMSHFKNGYNKLIITEGMFDLLSILEHNKMLEKEFDFLVLNSIAFMKKAVIIMNSYSRVEVYLDNDANGKRTTQRFMEHCSNCEDKSNLYSGFKDMNQFLMERRKVSIGH